MVSSSLQLSCYYLNTWADSKHFFFEKKKQKTSICLDPRRRDRRGPHVQKFFASFFKKEVLLSPA